MKSLKHLQQRYNRTIDKILIYFAHNKRRIRTEDYHAENRMVGSGVVDAANKI